MPIFDLRPSWKVADLRVTPNRRWGPLIAWESLLADLSPESPCGENLEYDPIFAEMERAAQGKPEQQFGEKIIPAEDPNWKEVQSKALEVLSRTRDLRVVVYLARAILNTGRLADFGGCIGLLKRLIAERWDQVHPRLDPDDGLDPTLRVNLLASLCDSSTMLRDLQKVPVVASKTLGRFNLRDLAVAKGDAPAPPDQPSPPTMALVDAAFMDCDLEELKADAKAVREAVDGLGTIESLVTERVGAGRSTSLKAAVDVLRSLQAVLDPQLVRRGIVETPAAGDAAGQGGNGQAPAAPPPVDEVRTREDVVRVLDKICEYYARNEPSSPIPLLLMRAKRLTALSFMEIIEDIAPDAVAQAKSIKGKEAS